MKKDILFAKTTPSVEVHFVCLFSPEKARKLLELREKVIKANAKKTRPGMELSMTVQDNDAYPTCFESVEGLTMVSASGNSGIGDLDIPYCGCDVEFIGFLIAPGGEICAMITDNSKDSLSEDISSLLEDYLNNSKCQNYF